MEQFQSVIKAYLDKRAEEDEQFMLSYQKEYKNIEECCRYIVAEAKKTSNGKNCCISDEVVFGWAVHYYDEDVIKVEKEFVLAKVSPASAPVVAPKPKAVPREASNQLSIFDVIGEA